MNLESNLRNLKEYFISLLQLLNIIDIEIREGQSILFSTNIPAVYYNLSTKLILQPANVQEVFIYNRQLANLIPDYASHFSKSLQSAIIFPITIYRPASLSFISGSSSKERIFDMSRLFDSSILRGILLGTMLKIEEVKKIIENNPILLDLFGKYYETNQPENEENKDALIKNTKQPESKQTMTQAEQTLTNLRTKLKKLGNLFANSYITTGSPFEEIYAMKPPFIWTGGFDTSLNTNWNIYILGILGCIHENKFKLLFIDDFIIKSDDIFRPFDLKTARKIYYDLLRKSFYWAIYQPIAELTAKLKYPHRFSAIIKIKDFITNNKINFATIAGNKINTYEGYFTQTYASIICGIVENLSVSYEREPLAYIPSNFNFQLKITEVDYRIFNYDWLSNKPMLSQGSDIIKVAISSASTEKEIKESQ